MKKDLKIYIVDWPNTDMYGFFRGDTLNQCANDSDIEDTKKYLRNMYHEYNISFIEKDYDFIVEEREIRGFDRKGLL